MSPKQLVYIANARLPTEKAHGYQICKMCEAFANQGVEVLLLHPERYQSDAELKEISIFSYYNVPPVFEVKTLPNWDVVPLSLWIPEKLFTGIFFTHALLWGFYAALKARKQKADLYYTRDSGIAFCLVYLGLPTVYEAHLVPKRAQKWLLRLLPGHRALQLVVVLTNFIQEQFVQLGFLEKKIIVLPDAVDLELFNIELSQKEAREHLQIDSQIKIAAYVGKFHTMGCEKGLPEIIQSAKYLLKDFPELYFYFIGGPLDNVPKYEQIIIALGLPRERFVFLEKQPIQKVPYYLKASDILLMPHPWNEFYAYYISPLKLFEYMSTKRPIIASRLPSIMEVLRDGENALMAEAGDSEAIAKNIRTLLENKQIANRIAEQAYIDVQKYTWKLRANRIINFLEELHFSK
ncbi:glycosyltransferase [Lyngbya aestuarii]|uniref:glycosyltransferase n=1 Tax=Lyngbya aestuarii TaxID=118322 RepID=UPI00403DCBC5